MFSCSVFVIFEVILNLRIYKIMIQKKQLIEFQSLATISLDTK